MNSSSGKNGGNFFSSAMLQMRQVLVCFCVALIGLFGPKAFLYPSPAEIASRPIPYQVISGETLLDFRYNHPYIKPTVSSSLLFFTGVWIPLGIIGIIGLWYLRRNNTIMLESSLKIMCAFLMAIGMSECTTNLIKFWVLRPRPNFYEHCSFDISQKACMGSVNKIVESQLSFPSGHTSLSFCSTTVILLWLWNQIFSSSEKNQQNPFPRLTSFLLLWGWSTFVSVSRIVDYWHHPSDVVAGLLLGMTCAVVNYHAFFS